ncbi:ABC transporter ATP-binding protein [Conexibacter sp. DBS9H8]|uniref:ABC transporter ATP-binding protein n=1 Tax=Conexibacter sp. DBS9H8 TaxID=2937801 RepID=UPI00200C003E|nr:ATP-binding cassette domain-containing protein [Conexibacter sp. DBS9H8]
MRFTRGKRGGDSQPARGLSTGNGSDTGAPAPGTGAWNPGAAADAATAPWNPAPAADAASPSTTPGPSQSGFDFDRPAPLTENGHGGDRRQPEAAPVPGATPVPTPRPAPPEDDFTFEHPIAEHRPARAHAGDGDGGVGPASSSRVSVVDEQGPRPEPPAGATEEEYKWHTYRVYPSGRPDAVEFIDTYRAFGKNRILRGLNMGLPEGMVSMILGPSGTGKSVCIKHMVGLLYPDQGDVLVHGHSVPNMVDDELFEMRKKFGLLFQDGALFGSMNLYDNVAFPLRQHTEKGEDEIEDIVMRRLNEVGLGHSRDKYPNELSGGMRKRAGFARALVLEPDIVLFDEPDSGLDPVRTSLLGELILEVHRDMMDEAKAAQKTHLPTFCVITHNVMMARRTADYINVLWKGRIVEAGPTEDMLNSPNPFIRQFLAGESMGPLTMD